MDATAHTREARTNQAARLALMGFAAAWQRAFTESAQHGYRGFTAINDSHDRPSK